MQIKPPDGPLARRVLAHIEADRDSWDQSVWSYSCGTAGCYAFWTVNEAGARFDADDPEYVELASLPSDVRELLDEHFSSNGESVHLADAAAALLGLADVDVDEYGEIHPGIHRANRLFNPSNTLGDLHRLVDELFPAAPAGGA